MVFTALLMALFSMFSYMVGVYVGKKRTEERLQEDFQNFLKTLEK